MTIGETIRRLRKEKGLTQDALADALEISRQAVAKWESGKSAPATENLLKLAALLEVPLEELAGPKEQPSCALEEYARMQLEQERKKQAAKAALRTELQRAAAIAAGYLAVYLACLTAFYLAGAKSCIWGWMQSCHILAVTCLVHLAFRLLGRRRAGGALLAGTLAAIPLANAAGLAVMERTLTGRNYGWVFYLAVLFAFCGLGCLWELRAAKGRAAAPSRRRRAAGAAPAFFWRCGRCATVLARKPAIGTGTPPVRRTPARESPGPPALPPTDSRRTMPSVPPPTRATRSTGHRATTTATTPGPPPRSPPAGEPGGGPF